MSEAWLEAPERGSLRAIRLAAWLTRRGGYGLGRMLLHPICLYFVAFSPRARRASRDYLARVLGRPARWRDVYRHFHTFASTLLDRVLFAGGRLDRFALQVHGAETIGAALSRGRGCLLVGAHLGSFELLRAAAAAKPGLVVNVMMHEGNAGKIAQWMREASPDHAARIIAPGRVDAMLRVRECLERGEAVALLADRAFGGAPTLPVGFLGATAALPTGPFRLAQALAVPVVLFFGLYRGPRCYDLHFESLSTAGETAAREGVPLLVRRYGARLEAYARKAPFNWFNFYDYWRA